MQSIVLRPDDSERAEKLSAKAGWNQTRADWLCMLRCGWGVGRLSDDGLLIATGLLLPVSGNLAWISMILVDELYRRRGLATSIMNQLMDEAKKRNLEVGLDATPDGREVYRKLGFTDRFQIQRWSRDSAHADPGRMAEKVFKIKPRDLPSILHFDQLRTGWNRGKVLADLYRRGPGYSRMVLGTDGSLAGFSLARRGRRAFQIGPVVARTEADALTLLGANATVSGKQVLDVPDLNIERATHLTELGFEGSRILFRMTLGDVALLLPRSGFFAITGPEYA